MRKTMKSQAKVIRKSSKSDGLEVFVL